LASRGVARHRLRGKYEASGSVITKRFPEVVLKKFVARISLFSEELNLTKTASVLYLSLIIYPSSVSFPSFPDTLLR
jgi:hypothetical protein